MREDTKPRTSVERGLMRGTPPPPERLVTSDNWMAGPDTRWGCLHGRELARTARIPRGEGPVLELPRDERDLAGVAVPFDAATMPLADALAETYTDGICAVVDDADA